MFNFIKKLFKRKEYKYELNWDPYTGTTRLFIDKFPPCYGKFPFNFTQWIETECKKCPCFIPCKNNIAKKEVK